MNEEDDLVEIKPRESPPKSSPSNTRQIIKSIGVTLKSIILSLAGIGLIAIVNEIIGDQLWFFSIGENGISLWQKPFEHAYHFKNFLRISI